MSTLGIYARLSKEDKSTSNYIGLEGQIKRGIEISKRYGYKKYQVFKEEFLSGTLSINKRPQLKLLFEEINLGNIQGLFVVDIDRWGRDHIETMMMKSQLKELGVKLYDVNGEINLSDASVELLTDMKSLFAAFEVKKTAARIKRRLETNVIEGRILGGIMVYGYTKDENKKMVVHKEEGKVVEQIFELALKGYGTKVIANKLNEDNVPTKRQNLKKDLVYGGNKSKKKPYNEMKWRDAVVYKILTNTTYKGERPFKGKIYKCPPIVSQSAFDSVQELIKERKKFMDTTNKYVYMLKGLLVCKYCGRTMYGRARANRHDYAYICCSQRQTKEFCGNRGVNIEHLNNLVWDSLMSLDTDVVKFYNWYETNNFTVVEQGFLERHIRDKNEAEKQIANLLRLGAGGNIPDELFHSEMERLNKWKEQIEESIIRTQKSLQTLDEKNEVINLIREHLSPIKRKELSDDKKAKVCRIFIEKVEVEYMKAPIFKHQVYITYKIDKLSQFRLAVQNEINYKKSGFSLRMQNVFKSHIIIQKTISPLDGEPMPKITSGMHPFALKTLNSLQEGIPPIVYIDAKPTDALPLNKRKKFSQDEKDDLELFPKRKKK